MTQIAPSLLSANFGQLDRDIDMLNSSEAAMLHLDVMDGMFVPNISFGFPVISAIARRAAKPLDAHLMVADPQRYVSQTRDAGAHIMTVHAEACTHLHRTVQQIKAAGMKASVALNPATPLVMLEDILPELDMVLVMSVNPGFGGQSFIRSALDKVRRLRAMADGCGSRALIEVDGGVNLDTGAALVASGADVLVAGSFVFSSPDPKATIAALAAL